MPSSFYNERVLHKIQSRDDGTTFKAFEHTDAKPLSGISRLDPVIFDTLPTFQYFGEDATATTWPARTYGETLTLQGSGAVPTIDQGAPFLGGLKSVKQNGGKFWQTATPSFGQISTGHCIIEAIVKNTPTGTSAQLIFGTGSGSDSKDGLYLYSTPTLLVGGFNVDTLPSYQTSALLTEDAWFYLFITVDRSQFFTVTANAVGNSKNITSGAGLSAEGDPWQVGASTNGIPFTSNIAYIAMYQPVTMLVHAELLLFIKERFHKACGIWPQLAKGTATPTTATRTFDAYLDKYEYGEVRKLYHVGNEWLRTVERRDSKTDRDNPAVVSNSFPHSEDIADASWGKVACSIDSSTGVYDDQGIEMHGIIGDATDAVHAVNSSLAPSSNWKHIFSAKIKKGDVSAVRLSSTNIFTYSVWAQFDLDAGTVGLTSDNILSTSIEDLGNDVYRCGFSYDGGTSSHLHLIVPIEDASIDDATFLGDGSTSNIYITAVQHDYSDQSTGAETPREYVRTVGTGRTLGEKVRGYLSEPQRTNLWIYSEDPTQIGGGQWAWFGITSVDNDAITAPDGALTGNEITIDATQTSHRIYQTHTLTAATYVFSGWYKKGTRDWVFLYYSSGPASCYFDLASGAVGTASSATGFIEDWGDGWYRCFMVFTGAASANSVNIYAAEADNDFVFTPGAPEAAFYVWGSQLELASKASSYIKTTTAARTRLQDQLVYPAGANVGGENPTAGSIEHKLLVEDEATDRISVSVNDGGASTQRVNVAATSGGVTSSVGVSTTTQWAIVGTEDVNDGEVHTAKVTYKPDDVKLKVDGSSDGTDDVDAELPTGLDQLRVGAAYNGTTAPYNGVVSELKIKKKAK